jgi:hypothetical protein
MVSLVGTEKPRPLTDVVGVEPRAVVFLDDETGTVVTASMCPPADTDGAGGGTCRRVTAMIMATAPASASTTATMVTQRRGKLRPGSGGMPSLWPVDHPLPVRLPDCDHDRRMIPTPGRGA